MLELGLKFGSRVSVRVSVRVRASEALNDDSGGASTAVADGRDTELRIERVQGMSEGHEDAPTRGAETQLN